MPTYNLVKKFISIDDIKLTLFVRGENPSDYDPADLELFYPQFYSEVERSKVFFSVNTVTRAITRTTESPSTNEIYFAFESDAHEFSLRSETNLSDFTSKFFSITDEFVFSALKVADITTLLRYRKIPISKESIDNFLNSAIPLFNSTQNSWFFTTYDTVREVKFNSFPIKNASYFPTIELATELNVAKNYILNKPISKGSFYITPDYSSTIFVWNELILGDYDIAQYFDIDGSQKVMQKRDLNWNFDIVHDDDFAESLFISYKKNLGNNFQTIYNCAMIDDIAN